MRKQFFRRGFLHQVTGKSLLRSVEFFPSDNNFTAVFKKNRLFPHFHDLFHIDEAAMVTSEKPVVEKRLDLIYFAVLRILFILSIGINDDLSQVLLNQYNILNKYF